MSTPQKMEVVTRLRRRYARISPSLNERTRRAWAATEAEEIGYGGLTVVCAATGMAINTVKRGLRDIGAPAARSIPTLPPDRIRMPGGGKKPITAQDPTLTHDLDALVEPTARGAPTSPLRWTTKSTTKLVRALQQRGHTIASPQTVWKLLRTLGYSLQSTRKTHEGKDHPDRDAQFRYVAEMAASLQRAHQPVISVDTKKKELVGDFGHPGQEWQPKGQPEEVRMHDFVDPKLGKVIPYGVYDLSENAGWVSVGIDHDTADFAVASIRRWWERMGNLRYPTATALGITADCGGSNGYRLRRWKVNLQAFADETGLSITVRHFPPGTSKWNRIEHRLFAFITKNWRGRPLLDRATVIELIASTRTETGLQVRAELDPHAYPTGRTVPDTELAQVNLERDAFHGEWNYTIRPRSRTK